MGARRYWLIWAAVVPAVLWALIRLFGLDSGFPLATLMAFDFAAIFSGAIVTETVFGWSGMGKLFTTSLTNIDPNPVMAFFLVSATAIVLFNMLADIAYAYLDPRIRLA